MSESPAEFDADLQRMIACLDRALQGRYPPKLPAPVMEEPKPVISRAEQLAARERYEISLLPQHPPSKERDALIAAQEQNWRDIEAGNLARKNAQIKVNDVSRPMSSFEGDIPFDNRKGQPAPLGINFVPFIAVTKWCYSFAPKHLLQPFASAFFDANKIYARDWDLYYVAADYCGVVTFIPEHQLQALFDDLNEAFPEAKIKITNRDYEWGLIIDFEDLRQDLRPRWLGRCASRHHYQAWTSKLSMEPLMKLPTGSPTDRSVEAFKAKVDAANAISKAKKKTEKQNNALVQRQDMVRQSLRSQRYLGLIAKSNPSSMPDISTLTITEPLDVTKPAPFACDLDAIFIAIDLEAYESPPRMVTEVGLATLDTRDLKGVAPGELGKEWHDYIRGRHIRVDEYKHLVNNQYVSGCPGAFEFGDSEFIPKKNVGSVLASCFRHPFSQKKDRISGSATEERNIVLVGHDLGQDIDYCHQIGFSVLNHSCIKESIDTVALYRAHTKDPNARSLGSILYDLDFAAWHLHNAGNDAVYTIQAMLAICVKSAAERGTDPEAAKKLLAEKTAALVEAAKEKAMEDCAGWDEGGDGGVPMRPTEDHFGRRGGRGGRGRGGGDRGRGGRARVGFYTAGGAILDV